MSDTPSNNRACEVALVRLLRRIPREHCVSLVTQWDSNGRETGHAHIPVGALMHRAANELAAAQARIKEMTEIGVEIQNERLARYEQAKMPAEPERLTMTRELAAGGVATVTCVEAHHYDKLRAQLAAQTVRADENERDARRYRDMRARARYEYRNGPGI